MSEATLETTEVKEESPVEVLVPAAQSVEYTFGVDGHLKYTQRPISFFGKMELFSVLGTAVEGALSSGGVNITDFFDDQTSATNLQEADQFVKAIAKIVQYVPDLLKDIYVISLGVPRDEREYVKSVMELPEIEGGLSDKQGMDILNTFIDQNWEVLLDFFKQQILPTFNKLTKGPQESQPSKPSKATRQRTPKQ